MTVQGASARRSGAWLAGVAAAAAAALLALASCAVPGAARAGASGVSSEPAPSAAPSAEAEVEPGALPAALAGGRILNPGWAVEPKQLAGVFVAPIERDDRLEYLALDSDGEALWTASRPLSCSGFALTRTADGRDIAVLTDVVSTPTSISAPTATAYDLRTGERVWGPVDVPGPYKGPGLVFAAAPAGFMGDVGEKAALDPTTGETLAAEAALPRGARIVSEHRGTVVMVDGEALRGLRADGARSGAGSGSGAARLEERWAIPLADHSWDAGRLGNATRHSELGGPLALLATGADNGALVNLDTGEIAAAGVTGAAFDAGANVVVAALADGQVLGIETDGAPRWELAAEVAGAGSGSVALAGAGGGAAYLRAGGAGRVLDAASGAAAAGAHPAFERGEAALIPALSSGAGTVVAEDGVRRVLVVG